MATTGMQLGKGKVKRWGVAGSAPRRLLVYDGFSDGTNAETGTAIRIASQDQPELDTQRICWASPRRKSHLASSHLSLSLPFFSLFAARQRASVQTMSEPGSLLYRVETVDYRHGEGARSMVLGASTVQLRLGRAGIHGDMSTKGARCKAPPPFCTPRRARACQLLPEAAFEVQYGQTRHDRHTMRNHFRVSGKRRGESCIIQTMMKQAIPKHRCVETGLQDIRRAMGKRTFLVLYNIVTRL